MKFKIAKSDIKKFLTNSTLKQNIFYEWEKEDGTFKYLTEEETEFLLGESSIITIREFKFQSLKDGSEKIKFGFIVNLLDEGEHIYLTPAEDELTKEEVISFFDERDDFITFEEERTFFDVYSVINIKNISLQDTKIEENSSMIFFNEMTPTISKVFLVSRDRENDFFLKMIKKIDEKIEKIPGIIEKISERDFMNNKFALSAIAFEKDDDFSMIYAFTGNNFRLVKQNLCKDMKEKIFSFINNKNNVSIKNYLFTLPVLLNCELEKSSSSFIIKIQDDSSCYFTLEEIYKERERFIKEFGEDLLAPLILRLELL